MGILFAVGGVGSVIAGCVAAAIFLAVGEGAADVFVQPGSRLASAAATGAFVVGIPALWIGLATYVVPLQIGGHRLAMPRLHNLALWLFAAGGMLVTIGAVADNRTLSSLAASRPATATLGANPTNATELFLAGLVIVGVATLLAALSLLTTILNRRGEGVRLLHVPAFTWGAIGTSVTLLLSTPVFIGGLVLLFFDQHYGGTLFAGGAGIGGVRIWEHELWLLGRPEALVFWGATIGIYCDVVATALRRPLVGWPIAQAASAAAPLLTLGAYIGATSVLSSPFAPIATIGAALFLVGPALAVLTFLASGRGSRPRLLPGLIPLFAHFALDGLLIAAYAAGLFGDVIGEEAAAFRNGQLVLISLAQPLIGLAAGLLHWAPKLRGSVASLPSAGLATLLILGGAVLLAAPGYIVGLGGSDDTSVIGAIGAAVLAVGLLSLLPTLVGPAGSSPGDPYEGLTLEWATASPPVRHNFEEVPEIRSAYPLHDARVAAAAPEGEAD